MRTLVLIFTLLSTAAVFAQEDTASQYFPTTILCTNWETVGRSLSRYGEKPMIKSQSIRFVGGNRQMVHMIIFTNPETRTWTMIEQFDNELYCIMGAGEDLQAFDNTKQSN